MTSTARFSALAALLSIAVPTLAATPASAQFTYDPAGTLQSGGRGRVDATVWVPTMRFPIRDAPAYANSQVYGAGGSMGPSGGQCAGVNYTYPWHDNYCEARSWSMPLCPATTGHQGQDIRPSTCRAGIHPAVAAADGTITQVGSYSVYLTAADGTRFEYLHMSNVAVTRGQRVTCGTVLGNVSNVFGGTPTTIHLHFNIRQAVRGLGNVWVPTYMSLVSSYERLLAGDAMCGASMDAGVRDASMPRDASMRDAFTPRDAYTPPRDAYTPPRDAYTPPRDAYTPPPDAYVPRDAYVPPRDGGGACRSSILGRSVANGECVQTGPEQRDCAAEGCGWYQCTAGAWTCSTPDACPGEQHPNEACSDVGASCHSLTLGAEVAHGACVQSSYPACGLPACGWYACYNGAWACSDREACDGDEFPHADCTDCGQAGTSCEQRSDCCTFFDCEPRTFGATDRQCCLQGNLDCTSSSDCCGTMECVGGRCACHTAGQPCAGDVDCCGGTWCTDGVCGNE